MAPLSANVNAGDDVLASQYNNLRADVLDPTTGHDHEGVEGKILDGAIAISIGTITEDRLSAAVIKKLGTLKTQPQISASTSLNALQTILTRSGQGRLNGIVQTGVGGSASDVRLKITVDGVIIFDKTKTLPNGASRIIQSWGEFSENVALVEDELIRYQGGLQIEYQSTVLIEHLSVTSSGTVQTKVSHSTDS